MRIATREREIVFCRYLKHGICIWNGALVVYITFKGFVVYAMNKIEFRTSIIDLPRDVEYTGCSIVNEKRYFTITESIERGFRQKR